MGAGCRCVVHNMLRHIPPSSFSEHGREVQRRLEHGLANKHVQSVADLRQHLLPAP